MNCPVCQSPIGRAYQVPVLKRVATSPRRSDQLDVVEGFDLYETCSQACGQSLSEWMRLKLRLDSTAKHG